ncbi:MAG: MBL fold metallo-hydrolase [Muribaculaceae bacterium]|nr:MBL fold metallo-hydrolase [Muribaculaceae bacterium]
MLNITRFVFNNFSENTYIVADSATRQAAVIDPGMLMPEEYRAFEKFVEEANLKLTQVILTHAHLDHCFGVNYVKDKYNIPVVAHSGDSPLAKTLCLQARRFGMGKCLKEDVSFDVNLKDGDKIKIGNSQLEVIHVPGHSPGGIVLYSRENSVAFVGDSIFNSSIGRTDLEGGDYETLIGALKSRVLSLPDDTVLLSGHGDQTTVGDEKKHNPFLR